MRHFSVTASGLWRSFVCLGSAILPRTPSTSVWSERGTALHDFLLDVNRVGRDEALGRIKDERFRSACELLQLERMPVDPTKYAAEVAFAFDVATGQARELHRKGDRDYSSCTPTEIAGTADVVALVGDDTVFVADWKTGFKYLPGPEANWQFRFLGLAAARAYGRSRAVVQMIRIGEDGYPYKTGGELDVFDLADIAEQLRELHADGTRAAASDAPLPLVTGSHCKGCDAMADCTAMTSMTRSTREPGSRIVGLAEKLVTDEDLVHAVGQRDALKAFLAKLDDEIEAYGTTHTVTFPDGSTFGLVEKSTSSPNGQAVWQMVSAKHGAAAAWEAVEIKGSWSKLEDLARAEVARLLKEDPKRKPKPTISGQLEAMREELYKAEAQHRDATGKKGAYVKQTYYSCVTLTPPKKVKELKGRKAG